MADKNVYILGAGFSNAIAELPLMKDFFTKMRDASSQENSKLEAKAIKVVSDYRQKLKGATERAALNLDNMEDLACLIEAMPTTSPEEGRLLYRAAIAVTFNHCWLEKLRSFQNRNNLQRFPFLYKDRTNGNWVIEKGFNFIEPRNVLLTELPNNDNYIENQIEDLPRLPHFNYMGVKFEKELSSSNYYTKKFDIYLPQGISYIHAMVAKAPADSSVFITFNYDEVLEFFLRSMGYKIDYVFDSLAPFSQKNQKPETIPVLKLHGSVNWYLENEKIKVADSYEKIRIDESKMPYLLPPTWRKSDSSVNEMIKIWDKAVEHIGRAVRIFIIGYSIPQTDLHFKYLLAAGLAGNIDLKEIVFINPEKEIEARWDWLFGDESRPIRKRIKRERTLEGKAPSFYGR